MYCVNCGKEIDDKVSFCPECGFKTNQNMSENIVNTNIESSEEKEKGNRIALISLICYFGGSIISFVASMLNSEELSTIVASATSLLPLAGLVLMIYGRIKYPKNTFLKVLMWIMIVLVILSIVYCLLLIITCVGLIRSC